MEPRLQSSHEDAVALLQDDSEISVTRQNLASMRSLIANPSTSESTISSVLETLTRSLQLIRNPLLIHHTLKLLSDLASYHGQLSHLVFDSVRSHLLLSIESTRLAAGSLDVLASIAERDPGLVSSMEELDDRLFVSLCFGHSVSVRTWLLNNAERFHVGPFFLFTVFLGFTKDPYPCVRKAALDGLVWLSESTLFEDQGMIEGCYYRAVELLRDTEDYVRSAAVRAVSSWGLLLITSNPEEKLYWSDVVFIELCFMTRDMSIEVRVQSFDALAKIEIVSENILLQSLSKRVLNISKRKKSLYQGSEEQLEISAVNAAGALVHGVEDEFSQVRKSACHAFRRLTILSVQFASEALSLLMDVLNDDSISVRLQALETMHHMATSDCLKVQEAHMHMFLGALVDNDARVRSGLRKILKLLKLQDSELFRLPINGLLESLELYPEDESDIFSVLFHIGRNHGKFVVCIIKEVSQQIEPTSEGGLGFNSARVAALLVLAISAPLACDQICNVPPRIFSYAVTILGRISRALGDVMDQNDLFAYLSQSSNSVELSGMNLNSKEGDSCSLVLRARGSVGSTLQQEGDVVFDYQNRSTGEPMELETSIVKNQQMMNDDMKESVNVILLKVKDIWPLIQSGMTREVLSTLRSCQESLATFTLHSLGSNGALIFTVQYLKIIKLLTMVWVHILPPKGIPSYGIGELRLILGKLERRLRELRSGFIGFSEQEKLHILELTLVTHTVWLSKSETFCHHAAFRKLSSTASHVESLLKRGLVEPSSFANEVRKVLSNGPAVTEHVFNPSKFRKLLDFFTLNQLGFHEGLQHVRAELVVLNGNHEHPLFFVPGLPVGIPCKIVLHNMSSEKRLWLRITVNNETAQFVYLDFIHFGGCDKVREFAFEAPLYRIPKATCFTATVCIGMECLFEDAYSVKPYSVKPHSVKRYGCPKRELTFICKERDVYLSSTRNVLYHASVNDTH